MKTSLSIINTFNKLFLRSEENKFKSLIKLKSKLKKKFIYKKVIHLIYKQIIESKTKKAVLILLLIRQ